VAAFPRIAFESTGVEQVSSDRLAVHGRLTLHGVTRPVVVNVRSENGRYVGVPPSSRKSLESRPLASPEAL
jgi:polyisoprenoid-binding protein YceI